MTSPSPLDLDRVVLGRSGERRAGAVTLLEATAVYAGEDPGGGAPSGMSPVVAEWAAGWADGLDHAARQGLRAYVPALAVSRLDDDGEAARQWLVVDWLARTRTGLWLQAAGLSDPAAQLAAHPPATTRKAARQCWAAVAEIGLSVQQARRRSLHALLDAVRSQHTGVDVRAVTDVLVDVGWAVAHHGVCWLLAAGTRSVEIDTAAALQRILQWPGTRRAGNHWAATWDTAIDAACTLTWNTLANAAPRRAVAWLADPVGAWAESTELAWHAVRPVRLDLDQSAQHLLDRLLHTPHGRRLR